MRPSARIAGPLFIITLYLASLPGLVHLLRTWFPAIDIYLPFDGIDALLASGSSKIEMVSSMSGVAHWAGNEALTLAIAIVGVVFLMIPISWVYFITTSDKRIDRSFIQTVMVLPVIVTGIAAIVQHSLALAFSLAGIVAAVRFRFTLSEPASALYIFVAIAVGLAAGISALGIAYVSTLGFVYLSLGLWRFNYGANLNTPFFAFLTSRGHDDKEL